MKKTSIYIYFICISLFALLNINGKNKPKPTQESLGKQLFFDKILSGNQTLSCASCHIPAFAFADTLAFSKGENGKFSKRNAPSVMNMASRESLFWDGRAKNLEDQVLFPIRDENEMNCPIPLAISRLNKHKQYKKLFKQVFNEQPNETNLAKAIASFEKTLETSNTANDRWLNDQSDGLTAQQEKGRTVFFNKGKCIECHFTPDFTGDEFKNIGLFDGLIRNDSGRYLITKNKIDIGKFKVPGLRNCAITAPYMHDGSFKTLKEVIQFYNTPQTFLANSITRDTLLQSPLNLSESEMQDLELFLNAMTDKQFE